MILDEEWSNRSSSTSTIIHTSSSTKTTGRFPWTSILKWSMYSQISRYSSIQSSSIQLVKYLPPYSRNHLCSLLSNYYYFYFYLSQVNLSTSLSFLPSRFFFRKLKKEEKRYKTYVMTGSLSSTTRPTHSDISRRTNDNYQVQRKDLLWNPLIFLLVSIELLYRGLLFSSNIIFKQSMWFFFISSSSIWMYSGISFNTETTLSFSTSIVFTLCDFFSFIYSIDWSWRSKEFQRRIFIDSSRRISVNDYWMDKKEFIFSRSTSKRKSSIPINKLNFI